jgi:hypothetical protein
MPIENIVSAIATLDQAVTGIEKDLPKFEQKMKSARAKNGNQLDLFGGPSAPPAPAPDMAELTGKLDRVMSKIKTVLGTAA